MAIPTGLIWFLFVLLAIGGYFLDRSRAKGLPKLSDADFLRQLPTVTDLSRETLLSVRKEVADTLVIPADRLAPRSSFDELSRQFGKLRGLNLETSDAGDDLDLLRRQAGVPLGLPFPDTLGQYIVETARLKQNPESRLRETDQSV